MKTAFLFCTKLYIFLIELPPIILLAVTVGLHDKSEDVFGFYPLEIFLGLLILFIVVYFFRAITVSTDEIRTHGVFSSKEKLLLKKDQTLVISMLPKNKLRLEVYGNLSEGEVYNWMRGGENHEISLFREKAVGGKAQVKKIMSVFGIEADVAAAALEGESFKFEDNFVALKTGTLNELFRVEITFKETII